MSRHRHETGLNPQPEHSSVMGGDEEQAGLVMPAEQYLPTAQDGVGVSALIPSVLEGSPPAAISSSASLMRLRGTQAGDADVEAETGVGGGEEEEELDGTWHAAPSNAVDPNLTQQGAGHSWTFPTSFHRPMRPYNHSQHHQPPLWSDGSGGAPPRVSTSDSFTFTPAASTAHLDHHHRGGSEMELPLVSSGATPAQNTHDGDHGRSGGAYHSNEGHGIHSAPSHPTAAHGPAHSSDHQHHHLFRRSTLHHHSDSAFDVAHSGKKRRPKGHITEHSENVPVRLGHLFKRPLIRQWLYDGHLYREKEEERKASRFELFFDTLFVGIIHVLADAASETAHGYNIAVFLVTFCIAWSIATDLRGFINVSGTDDVWQRIYILLTMLLLVGYTSNATAIKIRSVEEALAAGGRVMGSEGAEREASSMGVQNHFVELHRRSGGGGGEKEPLVLESRIGHTDFWFVEGYQQAIQAAIGFFLVAKCCRLLLYLVYAAWLPKFRRALLLNATMLAVITCVYLPLMFLKETEWILILTLAGIFTELLSRYIVAALSQALHGHRKKLGKKTFIPAYGIEHIMERVMLFMVLILGESVLVSTYSAHRGEYGPHGEYWRSSLGIANAFLLTWLYHDSDSSRVFVHALRRHWFLHITWTHIHIPLSGALILMSSALAKLVADDNVERGYLWYYCGSLSAAMVCLGFIGMLHEPLDVRSSALVPRWVRIGQRFVAAAIFGSLPLLHRQYSSLGILGTCVAILSWQVLSETFGKLGALGRRYDPVRAAQLRETRKLHHQTSRQTFEGEPGSGIAMAHLGGNSPPLGGGEKLPRPNMGSRRESFVDISRSLWNKDWAVKTPTSRDSWHEFGDLTGEERGEEDVGIESEIGAIQAKELSASHRFAYLAS